MNLVERNTILLSINEFIEKDIMDFTKIRLKNPLKPETGRPIDIGALAYTSRERTTEFNSKTGLRATLVDLNSLKKNRVFFISNLASELSNSKPATQNTNLKEMLPIIDWMDMNSHVDFLSDKQRMHEAYLEYTSYLNQRLKSKEKKLQIKSRVAKDKQWICRKIIEVAFPGQLSSIEAGITRIKAGKAPKEAIESSHVEHYWELNLELFTKFSKQLMSNDYFPPHIHVGKINSYYMPCAVRQLPIKTPQAGKNNPYTQNKALLPFFNYENGLSKPPKKSAPNSTIAKFDKWFEGYQLLKSDKKSKARIELGMKAQYAFIQCFRILTRINNAELIKLIYSDSYKKERDVIAQEFYEVKFRAGDKPVSYRIQAKGYAVFKKYLTLREQLLKGKDCPYLFFSLGEKNIGTPGQISRQHTDNHQQFLRKMGFLHPKSKAIKDQELRNLNTRFLRKMGFPAQEVADNNNHSLAVADQVYADNTLEEQVAELDNFFSAVKSVNDKNNQISKNKTRAITSGSCSEKYPESIPIIESPPFFPDCETPQGCLFCIYYVCHADEEDLRKLLSLKFVIALIKKKTIDFDFSDEMYALLELRVDHILDNISKKTEASKKLVLKMKKAVLNDGVLTAFWDNRLDYYEEMGLIVL